MAVNIVLKETINKTASTTVIQVCMELHQERMLTFSNQQTPTNTRDKGQNMTNMNINTDRPMTMLIHLHSSVLWGT